MNVLVVLLALFFTPGRGSAQTTSFSYTLSTDATTSAGVFDSTGALVRTLWAAKAELPGSHGASWDGLTDSGAAPTTGNGTYTFKVLSNNVAYHWDGTIGNTQSAWFNTHNQWDGLGYVPVSIRPTFVGTTAIVAPGYSEGTQNLFTFDTSDPNSPKVINYAYATQNVQFVDADNDGSFVYLPNAQVWSGENFITKFSIAGTPAAFTTGTVITSANDTWANIPMNGIDIYSDRANLPVAIAVQNTSRLLAVSYSGKTGVSPVIKFYDKITGAAVGTPVILTVQATSMGFTSAGLWYVSNGGLYLLTSPSVSSKATQPIIGLSNAVYVATNKRLNSIVVMDGGTHQQVFEYNSLYSKRRTYGTLGGYASNGYDPTITNSKLMLDSVANKGTTSTNRSWVKVDVNDGLWICDAGDAGRILHVDSTNTYVDQVQFGQAQYALAVSQSVPTRIFKHGIEYAIDYTKPLLPGDPTAAGGNGAWKMVKNWTAGAEGANGSPVVDMDSYTQGIQNVEQLSNGRVYGLVNNSINRYEVEFPAAGPLRYTTGIGRTGWFELEPDGSLEKKSASGTAPDLTLTVSKSALTGFDAAGNPVRSPYSVLGKVAYNSTTQAGLQDGGWGDHQSYQATKSGVIPMFQTSPVSTGSPHLGGFLVGRSDSPLFEVYPEAPLTHADFRGIFPGTSGYGGHSGQRAQALGTNIFTGYDGQYAPWGQTYCHWYQDGLLVNCYGLRAEPPAGGYKVPDSSGNISTEKWVSVGSDIYMYHTTESQLTVIHRWHITNLSSIYEATGSGVIGSSVHLH